MTPRRRNALSEDSRSRLAGSALVVVLWVIGLLSVIVTSFAFDAHLEIRIAGFARRRRQAESLALSGLSVAEMLLHQQRHVRPDTSVDDDDRWHMPALSLSRGEAVRGLQEPLGDGIIVLDIVPEDSLRNVNRLDDEDWERILEVGGVPEDRWPELIDAFNHWTDKVGYVIAQSAEIEDYYALHDPPYRAKQGPLDTVRELLLVKGFENAIVSGGVLNPDAPVAEQIHLPGIQDLLTTYGEGKVNVNAAAERVLMTLPGVDLLTARAIREERGDFQAEMEGIEQDLAFASVSDFMGRIPELPPEIQSAVSTHSTIFRVTSVGRIARTSRRIESIVEWDSSRDRMHILRWRED